MTKVQQLLHKLWRVAVGQDGYVKPDWVEFQLLIEKIDRRRDDRRHGDRRAA